MRLTHVATALLMLAASTLMFATAEAWHLPLRLVNRQLNDRTQVDDRGSKRAFFRPVEGFSLQDSGGYPHSAQFFGDKKLVRQMPL